MSLGPGFLEAFQILAIVLTRLSELLLPFNQWIVSPSRPADATFKDFHPSALTTALTYAIADPLAYKAMTLVSLPPTFVIGLLAQSVPFAMTLLCDNLRLQQLLFKISQQPVAEGDHRINPEKKSDIKTQPYFKDPPPRPSCVRVYYALLAPIAITAILNASLLLFQQFLSATSPTAVSGQPGTLIVWGTILICYITTSFFVSFAKDCHRSRFIGAAGINILRSELLYLTFLLTARAATRKLLGINPLVAFVSADQALTNDLVKRESYSTLKPLHNSLPSWWAYVSGQFGWIAVVAGAWLVGEARLDKQKRFDELAAKHLVPGTESPVPSV